MLDSRSGGAGASPGFSDESAPGASPAQSFQDSDLDDEIPF